ncbi:ABC-type antimicrobial peptide transport system permease subunit [Chitinophaga skermanii]|uniref:ABC-type antimicrobial peptide transport system permease subunit n=1 Tax=Chitinophaga skermanii TaxID=331697 RepID=A0A327QH67_9BACT|nr:ABC transporter permease [Chitinophaga skermanii]RAJ03889.1 ABC-type antimicrobial peptide transport system permease subunit [Chitinophaga skermanii]
MIKNYFKIAWRNIKQRKVFSIINILGLAIGISTALVIYMMVHYETHFDTFHPNKERIFRIVTEMPADEPGGEGFHNGGVPTPMYDAAQDEIAAFQYVAPVSTNFYQTKVTIGNEGKDPKDFISVDNIVVTNEQYFDIIQYKWLAGNAKSMAEVNQVVLTADRAKQYYPNMSFAQMIGQGITLNDSLHFQVAGVVEQLQGTTDFNFKTFISYKTVTTGFLHKAWYWGAWNSINSANQLLVMLRENTPIATAQKQLWAVNQKYIKPEKGKTQLEQIYHLSPIQDLHFTGYDNFGTPQANKEVFKKLTIVAICLLLLACINFVNLNTAQGTTRAKEVGIRKSLGSSVSNLVARFLGESFVLTCLSAILSICMVPLILQQFSDFLPGGLSALYMFQWHVGLFLVGLVVVMSLLAGLYPAWVLSKYKPISVLRGRMTTNTKSGGISLRQVLTVLQFTFAIGFIVGTFIVIQQIKYALTADLGYRKDAIVNIRLPFSSKVSQTEVFAGKLEQMSGVKKVSKNSFAPSTAGSVTMIIEATIKGKKWESAAQIRATDKNYIDLFQLELVAGRNFLRDDTLSEAIINESMAKAMGFSNPNDALNQFVSASSKEKLPVVGVIKDFHFRSFRDKITPLMMRPQMNMMRNVSVLVGPTTQGYSKTMQQFEAAFKSVYPDNVFDATFFDQQIADLYSQERNTLQLLSWATGLIIFISSLGMLGLVIHATQSRTKEIGVRKVLGASVTNIVVLVSKDFVKLIIISLIIATPISYYLMKEWLSNFAYGVSIHWWVFGLAGLGAIVIAVATISYQTIKAAMVNPIESLKSE